MLLSVEPQTTNTADTLTPHTLGLHLNILEQAQRYTYNQLLRTPSIIDLRPKTSSGKDYKEWVLEQMQAGSPESTAGVTGVHRNETDGIVSIVLVRTVVMAVALNLTRLM